MINNTAQGTANQINPDLLSNIIFVGSYVNDFIITYALKIIPLTPTQVSILIALIYAVLLFMVIKVIEITKVPLKIGIIILICLLIIGFFKPV